MTEEDLQNLLIDKALVILREADSDAPTLTPDERDLFEIGVLSGAAAMQDFLIEAGVLQSAP